MTDLQCPAKVVLVARDVPGDAASMSNVARVRYAGVFGVSFVETDAGDLACVNAVAEQASCRLHILADAVDGASLRRAIDDLADLYRGETILVIATRDMMREVSGGAGDSARSIAIAIDSSGWTLLETPPAESASARRAEMAASARGRAAASDTGLDHIGIVQTDVAEPRAGELHRHIRALRPCRRPAPRGLRAHRTSDRDALSAATRNTPAVATSPVFQR